MDKLEKKGLTFFFNILSQADYIQHLRHHLHLFLFKILFESISPWDYSILLIPFMHPVSRVLPLATPPVSVIIYSWVLIKFWDANEPAGSKNGLTATRMKRNVLAAFLYLVKTKWIKSSSGIRECLSLCTDLCPVFALNRNFSTQANSPFLQMQLVYTVQ